MEAVEGAAWGFVLRVSNDAVGVRVGVCSYGVGDRGIW